MPIQQVRQKSKTEAFGDIFGGVTGGLLQGKLLKRKQGMEDKDRAMREAMQVWQMAQKDYLNQPPMTEEQARGKRRPGEKMTTRYDVYGRPAYSISPPSFIDQFIEAKMMLGESAPIQDVLALVKKMNEAGGVPGPELFPDNGGLPSPGGSDSLIDSLNRGPNNVPPAPVPTPTPAPNVNLGQTPTIGEMALQADKGFLEPDILPPLEGLVGKGKPSKPSRPFFGKPTMPSAVDSLIPGMGSGMGAGAIAPSPSGRPTAPSIAPQIATAEPKTIAEFEDNIRIIAKTDKKKAKEYYEKWKSKW